MKTTTRRARLSEAGITRAGALRQLREAVARGVSIATIPRADLAVIGATLQHLQAANEQAIQHAPLVFSAVRRLADGIQSDALRLASVRDVDVLLTFNASLGSSA